ncbi:hypothetical protein Tco_0645391 [Tanacetum coccineum]
MLDEEEIMKMLEEEMAELELQVGGNVTNQQEHQHMLDQEALIPALEEAREERTKQEWQDKYSSHGRITPISLLLVYNEDEYNYNYYMMYKNQKYDLDNAMEMRNKTLGA